MPLPIPGDRRAWDACLVLGGRRAGCEAETRLTDVQAMERRLALKMRDGEVDLLLLLVSDTATNRHMLALNREALRTLLPLDGRNVLTSLGSGRLPAGERPAGHLTTRRRRGAWRSGVPERDARVVIPDAAPIP